MNLKGLAYGLEFLQHTRADPDANHGVELSAMLTLLVYGVVAAKLRAREQNFSRQWPVSLKWESTASLLQGGTGGAQSSRVWGQERI
jgi:hypothetical protein